MDDVQGLSQDNRAVVIQELAKLAYCVATMVSDLARHGVPCRRVRVCFVACFMPGASGERQACIQTAAQSFEVVPLVIPQLTVQVGRMRSNLS